MDVLSLEPSRRQRAAEVLLLAFLATVAMLFAGFTSAYLIRRTGSDWSPLRLPPLVWANLGVLVLSSVTIERARRLRSVRWTRATLALGVLFLGGQLLAWSALSGTGTFLTSRPQGAFFFLLSAVHGLHLVGGLAALGWLSLRAAAPRLAAVYWHFLGLVWLSVLLLLRAAA